MSDPGGPTLDPAKATRRSWADVGPRVVSALVLIVLTATALYVGSYLFAAVVGAVYGGAYREWETMVSRAPLTPMGWALIGNRMVCGSCLRKECGHAHDLDGVTCCLDDRHLGPHRGWTHEGRLVEFDTAGDTIRILR